MQTALEAIAQKLVAQFPQNVTKPVTNSASRKTIHRAAARKAVKPALPAFTDEQFNAYELSYGGGATLVFSATSGQGDAAKYITLIAQPDFNGTPISALQTDRHAARPILSMRMKLIDAVDTDDDKPR